MSFQGGISSSILSVIFTDKLLLSANQMQQISVAYKQFQGQWKSLTKCLMKHPPGLHTELGH